MSISICLGSNLSQVDFDGGFVIILPKAYCRLTSQEDRMNWDRNLPSASRFTILSEFNNEAVLDNNTGLVWEKSPQGLSSSWDQARFTCINKTVGGQKGWRLPSVPELASLIDPSVVPPGPTLPPGHPFLNVQES